eukprot:CAMPEP_0181424376 /NCGR_PEP_ID=MMETSP1110-20121109/14612_1 /TAXON_ID=174948 /ORGANISM="Symbiodinium sp., Strain CCMP421" /LENGTH=160 /DNA_ID=CAMNT_0023547531 /DNA_START=67 /DNA_END=549 /DNA_ORIENTATION=+
MSIVVLDGVVDNDLRQLILSKFDPLAPGARTALPDVLVPKPLEQWLQSVLRSCAGGHDPSAAELPGALDGRSELVPMPGRVAVGSSPMHQDTGFDAMGRPDPTRVEGLVAVLYLARSETMPPCGVAERPVHPSLGCLPGRREPHHARTYDTQLHWLEARR